MAACSEAINLVTAADWRRMIEEAGFTIEQTEMIGRAVYPGCLRWSARIAGERRRAMVNKSTKAGGSLMLKMMQAWLLELLLYRTFFATMIRLRLREYVLVVARKLEAPILW